MFTQDHLLRAVSSRSMNFKNDVEPILASLLQQGIYITARNNNGVSIHDILFRFQIPAFLSAINLHNDRINKRRQSTIPTYLLQSTRQLNLPQIQESYLQHPEMDINFLVGMAIDVGHSVDFIRELVQIGRFNPNARGIDGEPLIHIAAKRGDIDILRLLVESGANPQVEGVWHKTILHSLSAFMNRELLTYFLNDLAFDINEPDYDKKTLLHIAIYSGNIQSFYVILKFRPGTSKRDRNWKTPREISEEICKLSYLPKDKIQEINDSRKVMKRALVKYIEDQRKRERVLITASRGDSRKISLVNSELHSSDISSIRKVLKKNTEKIDISGNYLDDSCADKLIDLFSPLNRLIKVHCQNNLFSTAVMSHISDSVLPKNRLRNFLKNSNIDSFNARVDDIKFYIDNDLDILEIAMENGCTLTHYCIMYNNIELLEFLKKKQINFLVIDNNGRSLLEHAIQCRSDDAADWLIGNFGKIIPILNVVKNNIDHPLTLAIKNSLPKTVLALLKQSIDPNKIYARIPLLNCSLSIIYKGDESETSENFTHFLIFDFNDKKNKWSLYRIYKNDKEMIDIKKIDGLFDLINEKLPEDERIDIKKIEKKIVKYGEDISLLFLAAKNYNQLIFRYLLEFGIKTTEELLEKISSEICSDERVSIEVYYLIK